MLAKDIITIMEKYYPLSKQEEWDKCGLQIGDTHTDVQKVMISLNADIPTLDEAIEKGCQMLITHHPFLLDPIVNIEMILWVNLYLKRLKIMLWSIVRILL